VGEGQKNVVAVYMHWNVIIPYVGLSLGKWIFRLQEIAANKPHWDPTARRSTRMRINDYDYNFS